MPKKRKILTLINRFLPQDLEAAQSSKIRFRHATIIFDPDTEKLLSVGYNFCLKQPDYVEGCGDQPGKYWSIHSEIAALRKLNKSYTGNLVLVNIRINSEGEIVNSKPCPNCAKAIEKCKNVRTVYFS